MIVGLFTGQMNFLSANQTC